MTMKILHQLMICSLSQLAFVHDASSATHGVNFSRGVSTLSVYKRIPNLSIESCSKECKARRRCKQALYNRAAKVCSLTHTVGGEMVRKGDALLTGFDGLRKVDSSCGAIQCDETETCVNDTNGHTCTVSECMDINHELYTTYGNVNNVNSVRSLDYRSTGLHVKMTCNSDGIWHADKGDNCCLIGCKSGVALWPYNVTPFYCDMDTDGGHWVVFQARKDGSEVFYRPWNDYTQGFGNITGEHWLGLDNIYNILSFGSFELRIDLEDFNGETRYAKYSSFSIDGPANKYTLHVTGYSGTAGDSLTYQNGSPFSTYDQDNDSYHENCAIRFTGAWWYRTCHHSNLNGMYHHGGGKTNTFANNIQWYHWHGYWISLKGTEMKFRRIK